MLMVHSEKWITTCSAVPPTFVIISDPHDSTEHHSCQKSISLQQGFVELALSPWMPLIGQYLQEAPGQKESYFSAHAF